MKTLDERFEEVEEMNGGWFSESLKFEAVENKLHPNRDIHALIYVYNLTNQAPIQGADHDVIYLAGDCSDFEESLTDEQILELIRAGVSYSSEFGCLTLSA